MFRDGREMCGQVTPGEESAMHGWMQRLHPAIEHLREVRDVADVLAREPGVAERLGCSTCGDELVAERSESLGELHEALFI